MASTATLVRRVCIGARHGPGPKITQIYEGTNEIQRVVMARQLLKG